MYDLYVCMYMYYHLCTLVRRQACYLWHVFSYISVGVILCVLLLCVFLKLRCFSMYIRIYLNLMVCVFFVSLDVLLTTVCLYNTWMYSTSMVCIYCMYVAV